MASFVQFSFLLSLSLIVLINFNHVDAQGMNYAGDEMEGGDDFDDETEEVEVIRVPKKKMRSGGGGGGGGGGGMGNDDDEDDLTFNPPEATGRKDCIDDDEIEDCTDECNDNTECRRIKHNFQCEDHCEQLCKYLEMNIARKCILNLTGGLAEYRYGSVRGRRKKSGRRTRGGRRRRRG